MGDSPRRVTITLIARKDGDGPQPMTVVVDQLTAAGAKVKVSGADAASVDVRVDEHLETQIRRAAGAALDDKNAQQDAGRVETPDPEVGHRRLYDTVKRIATMGCGLAVRVLEWTATVFGVK